MTPKEQAIQLVDKYSCRAIEVVNEILEATKETIDRPDYYGVVYSKYWQLVKEEIQAL
jgi:hypothetical protein